MTLDAADGGHFCRRHFSIDEIWKILLSKSKVNYENNK